MFTSTDFQLWQGEQPGWAESDRNLKTLQAWIVNHPAGTISDWSDYVEAHLEPDVLFDWRARDTRGIPFSALTKKEQAAYQARFNKTDVKTAQRAEQEKAAEESKANYLAQPRIVAETKRQIENYIHLWRASNHSQTARERVELSEVAGDYQSINDASIHDVLKAVQRKGEELCPTGIGR